MSELWKATVSEPYTYPWEIFVTNDLEFAKAKLVECVEERRGEFDHGGWETQGNKHFASTQLDCAKVEPVEFYREG